MIATLRGGVVLAATLALAGCSGAAPVAQQQGPQFISHTVRIASADWYTNRPLVDLFVKDGPYQWVEVTASSEGAARVVAGWLREDGVGVIKPVVSDKQDLVTLVGYWPAGRANAPQQ